MTVIAETTDPRFAGPPAKATWMADLSKSDWLFDGYPIRGEIAVARFEALDWSKAWMDTGPSPAGNSGPYWHVPLVGEDETIHRLYPKLLTTKWLPVVRQAIAEAVAAERERCAQIAESHGLDAPGDDADLCMGCGEAIATSIRQGSPK